MNDEIFVCAYTGDVRFAAAAPAVIKIIPDPTTIPVPDAPEGICAVVYDEGQIIPVRALSANAAGQPKLVILCSTNEGTAAYAADGVETMRVLSVSEREKAQRCEDTDIMLLDGKDII
jgi:Chemotaxis signal transduction protein